MRNGILATGVWEDLEMVNVGGGGSGSGGSTGGEKSCCISVAWSGLIENAGGRTQQLVKNLFHKDGGAGGSGSDAPLGVSRTTPQHRVWNRSPLR